jgi:hypothetical protein
MTTKKQILDELIEFKCIKKLLEAEIGIIEEGIEIFSKSEKRYIVSGKDKEDIDIKLMAVKEKIKERENDLLELSKHKENQSGTI